MSGTRAKMARDGSALAKCGTADTFRSDDEQMARVGQGESDAYAALVGRHLPTVFRLCARLLNDRHEAEDVAQESFARLWQCAPNWRSSGGGVPAWLHRVATNLCFDRLRRRRDIILDEVPDVRDDTPSAVQCLEARELEAQLGQCLASLPDRHRAALVLSYYEGYSNALAAQIMDMNIKAFESLLLRARRRMSEELERYGIWKADLAVLA
jgi:RNA polymerase sigma factor (sigma-70 family)